MSIWNRSMVVVLTVFALSACSSTPTARKLAQDSVAAMGGIDKLQSIMNVKKAFSLDGVPDEIRFVIPNIDLPAPSETDPGDIKFAMTRYVHFDSMPEELQQVVRSYLSLRRGVDTLASRRFKKAISELAKRAEATFDGIPDDVA